MIVTGWRVENYGALENVEAGGLGGGLTLFHGPNEAGKSTLVAFLAGVLFKYPRKNQAGYYPPLGGGVHGGELTLRRAPDLGEWLVRREVARNRLTVTGPNGETGDEALLAELLGPADDAVFRSVYCLDLGKLASLDEDDGKKVRDRLFSAGLQGQGVSAVDGLDRVAREMDELFTPRGSKPKLKELFKALEENRKGLRELDAVADTFPHLLAERETLEARLAALANERDEARRRGELCNKLLELWPLHVERAELAGELDALGEALPLPAHGVERIKRHLDRRDKARAERAKQEQRLATLAEEAKTFAPDENLLARGAALDGLLAELSAQEERRKELREASRARDEAAAALDRALAALGANWTRDRLDAVRAHPEARSLVRGFEVDRERAERAVDEARQSVREAETRLDQARLAPPGGGRLIVPGAWVTGAALAAVGFFVEGASLAFFLAGALVAAGGFAAFFWEQSRHRTAIAAGEALCAGRRASLETAEEDLAAQGERWRGWTAEIGWPELGALPPREGGVRWARFEEADRAEAMLVEREARQARLAGEVAAWEARTGEDLTGVELLDHLRGLGRAVAAEREKRAKRDHLEERLLERRATLAETGAELADAEEEIAGLLAHAQAATEEEFFARAEREERRRAIEERRATLQQQFHQMAGEGQTRRAVEAALAEADPDRWQSERDGAREDYKAADGAWGETHNARGRLEEKIERLESSGARAELEMGREADLVRARALASRWRTLAVAHALLEKTLRRFSEENQPEALAAAGRYFAQATGGRYPKIQQVPGAYEIRARRADGALLAADELSRGTREALYLALRMALAGSYSRRAAPLPFVMDDLLVNLDPARAARMARAIVDFAAGHQVFLFTCHPSTVALFTDVDKGLEVRELRPAADLSPTP